MIYRILGIPGSLRRNSLNRSLLEAAAELMSDKGKLEMADLSDLPLYNWDVEQELGFRTRCKGSVNKSPTLMDCSLPRRSTTTPFPVH